MSSDDASDSGASSSESVAERGLQRAFGEEPEQQVKRRRRVGRDEDDNEDARMAVVRQSAASRPVTFTKAGFSKSQNAAAAKQLLSANASSSLATNQPTHIAPAPAPLPAPAAPSRAFGSVAAKYLAKYGFTGRLGKDGQGIAQPIEVMQRPEGAGLGMVQEASSLPENRANTEHLERMRLEAEAREARERERLREAAEIDDLWRRVGGGSDVAPLRGDEDKGPGADLARKLESMQSTAQLAEEAAQRDKQVAQGLATMRSVEQARSREELARVTQRLQKLQVFIADVMEPLCKRPPPKELRSLLSRLKAEEFDSLVLDYDLHRLGPGLIVDAVETQWDRVDYCLDLVDALEEAGMPVEQAVVRHVLPRLAVDAAHWDWNAQGGLHLLFFPWLPHIPGSVYEALQPAKDAIEARLGQLEVSLRGLEAAQAALRPWEGVLDKEAVQRLVSRAMGPRLSETDDVAVIVAWFNAGLLPRLETICAVEGGRVLAQLRRNLTILLAQRSFAAAATTYSDVAGALPKELLVDAPAKNGGIRLRLHLDVLLESMEAALEERPPRPLPLVVPQPRSFAEALHSHAIANPVEEKQFVPKVLARDAVQRFAEANDVVFMAWSGESREGKKLYRFGHVPMYIDDGVIFAQAPASGTWGPVSLDKLLEMDRMGS